MCVSKYERIKVGRKKVTQLIIRAVVHYYYLMLVGMQSHIRTGYDNQHHVDPNDVHHHPIELNAQFSQEKTTPRKTQ